MSASPRNWDQTLTYNSATAAALIKTSFLPSYGRTGDWLWDSRNLTIWTAVGMLEIGKMKPDRMNVGRNASSSDN